MPPTKSDLSADYVRSILDYSRHTGEFRWRERADAPPEWNSCFAGKIAGTINQIGYRQIAINSKRYLGHRLAWLVVTGEWPNGMLDHRDMNRANNRFENLRLATKAQNMQNREAPRHNTSGHKGVYWDKSKNRWLAAIGFDGKLNFIGRFRRKEDAIAAYEQAAKRHHGEFARTNMPEVAPTE